MFRVRNLVNTTKVNKHWWGKSFRTQNMPRFGFVFTIAVTVCTPATRIPQRGRGRTRRNTSFIYCVIALEIARDAALSTVRTRLAVWRPFLHLFFGLRARGTDKAGTRKPLRETSQGNQSLVCAQSRESLLVVDLRSYQRAAAEETWERSWRGSRKEKKLEGEEGRRKKTEGDEEDGRKMKKAQGDEEGGVQSSEFMFLSLF